MPRSTDSHRVALITGATRGIGRAIAVRLAGRGMDLFLTGRNVDKLDRLRTELHDRGVRIEVLAADLEQHAPAGVVRSCTDAFGRLDVLVNNAGMAASRSVEDTDMDLWDQLMHVNARAPFMLCQAAIPWLRTANSGTIINISSVVGRLGYPMQAAYGASKHALVGFSKVLAKELQKDNIRVHVVAPGGVDTDLVGKMRPDIKRDELIRPEEVADVVEFLVDRRGNGVIDEINIRRASGTPWA